MPSKLDDYINNLPKDQQQNLQSLGKTLQDKSSEVPQNASSDSVEQDYQQREETELDKNVSGHTPDPEYKKIDDGVKAQVDQALETPQEPAQEPKQGVEAQYPSSAEKGEEVTPQQEKQQDLDRWEDDGGR